MDTPFPLCEAEEFLQLDLHTLTGFHKTTASGKSRLFYGQFVVVFPCHGQ